MTTKAVNLARALIAKRNMKFYEEMMTTEFKMPEPCHMSISYDGKTPYSFYFQEDCELLDMEVSRLGGTASKLALYTADNMRAVIDQCAKLAQDEFDPHVEIRKLLEQVK